jgi:HSP20 family protein
MTKLHIKPSREEFMVPFDSLFDDIIQKTMPSFTDEFGVNFFGSNSYPKVDVIDYDDRITIEAEIPGLSKKEVSVDLEENILTISGAKQSKDESLEIKYIRKELKRSSFKRSFKLGENINQKNVNADFNNGVLLITLPKKEPEKLKKIKIL